MKLWQKDKVANSLVDRFTVGKDREYDLKLAQYDCMASIAHAKMLGKQNYLKKEETEKLVAELEKIKQLTQESDFIIENEFEDIHSKIEFLLTQKLGDIGKKIHTARSRNDQVLVAIQLFLKEELFSVKKECFDLFNLFLLKAEEYKEVLMPGYTHMQVAMPSSFGLWFSAYAETLIDDLLYFDVAIKVIDQNPLGSAAGYGSSFDIDREFVAKNIALKDLKINSIACQINRGRVEKASSMALDFLATTLSKFAMDCCYFMSNDLNFISFSEEWTTGSSIMPHKKNPDLFELVRGKCNLIKSIPNSINMLYTNLPSGYHREVQLLKKYIIEGFADMHDCLQILKSSISEIKVNEKLLEQDKYKPIFSVEEVNKKIDQGVPFRDAYKQVGEAIENNTFEPELEIHHKHLGSIGNLGLEKIKAKMKRLINESELS